MPQRLDTQGQSWLRLAMGPGLAVLIVLSVLGFIPGINPIDKLVELIHTDHSAIASQINTHNDLARDSLKINRMICRGVWKGNLDIQRECER